MDKQIKNTSGRPAMGRGLASLLPNAGSAQIPTPPPMGATGAAPTASVAQDSSRDRHPGISMCSVDEIIANDYQPRKIFHDETLEELSQSIKINGLIQPLIVRKNADGGYQLIAGERRLRAAKMAGLKQVPIVIRRTTDKEALELALLENIQREDLNCVETALAYFQLMHEFNLTQEELAERMGKDRSSVANHLRLLKLPPAVQLQLRDNLLTFGHGKALAGLEEAPIVERLAREASDNRWSVRELENQIQKIKNLQKAKEAAASAETTPLELRLRTIGKDLSQKLSTKVKVRGNEAKGKIVIEYFSGGDLERVLSQLMRS